MPQQSVANYTSLLQPADSPQSARSGMAFTICGPNAHAPATPRARRLGQTADANSSPRASMQSLSQKHSLIRYPYQQNFLRLAFVGFEAMLTRLRATYFYDYIAGWKRGSARIFQSTPLAGNLPQSFMSKLGQSLRPTKGKALVAGLLLLPCLALGLGINLWLEASAGPQLHTLRQTLTIKTNEALGGRLFPSQAEELSRLADIEDSLAPESKRERAWQMRQKMVPLAFASSLSVRQYQPDVLAWAGQDAPMPHGSLLSLGKESPLFTTLAGAHALPQATDFAFSGPSEPYDANQMQRIATGEQAVESLLDEFRDNPNLLQGRFVALRAAPVTENTGSGGNSFETLALTGQNSWGINNFDEFYRSRSNASDLTSAYDMTDPVSGLLCRSDRMELASWLGEMRQASLGLGLQSIERASKYSNYVERYSTDYELPPSLIYAIMRTESSFDPNAVSIANALGLMQVVPSTAGGEVYAFLTGKRGTPGRDVLFRPESNIQYGTAYLHLLNSRHFNGVENHISRELCMIAAYNGGPNAVLRAFDRDKTKAVAKINQLTPEQLYTALVGKMPSQETRDYVVKVVEARNKFRHNPAF